MDIERVTIWPWLGGMVGECARNEGGLRAAPEVLEPVLEDAASAA